MGLGARLAVAVPAVFALVGLAISIVPLGIADWHFQSVRNDLRNWANAGMAPTAQAWEGARAVTEGAVRLAPGNPSLQQYLGTLHLTEPSLPLSPQFAAEQLARAVDRRPSAPYPWIGLLVARYKVGIQGEALEKLLVPVWRLGSSEPAMQVVAADLGLAVWNEMGPEGRAVVEQAVAAGMRRGSGVILEISQRRGSMSLACSHVGGDRRLAKSSWPKACGL